MSYKLCTQCGDEVALARVALGYRLCKECSDTYLKAYPPIRTIVPLHKSTYTLVTSRETLKDLNKNRNEL